MVKIGLRGFEAQGLNRAPATAAKPHRAARGHVAESLCSNPLDICGLRRRWSFFQQSETLDAVLQFGVEVAGISLGFAPGHLDFKLRVRRPRVQEAGNEVVHILVIVNMVAKQLDRIQSARPFCRAMRRQNDWRG